MQASRNFWAGLRMLVIAALVGLIATGCTTQPRQVRVTRDVDMKVVAGEHMVIVLSRYLRDGQALKDLNTAEATLEACIREEMREVNGNLMFLPPSDFRKIVPGGASGTGDIGSQDSLLRTISDPAIAGRLQEAQIRYVVLLDASFATLSSKGGVAVDGASGGVAVVREWMQDSVIEATIFDLKHARVAGSAKTRSIGAEAGGVMMALIFPIPIYYNSLTESGNCRALARELTILFRTKT